MAVLALLMTFTVMPVVTGVLVMDMKARLLDLLATHHYRRLEAQVPVDQVVDGDLLVQVTGLVQAEG